MFAQYIPQVDTECILMCTMVCQQNTCEEACFPFEEYEAMLLLNPKLIPSHTIYPCNSHGYSTYLETVSNGAEPGELTMDVYIKPMKSTTEKCCEGMYI
jgi:hypothetical protein